MEWLTIHGEQRATLVERRENNWLLVELDEDGSFGPRGRHVQVKERFAKFDDQQMTPPGSPMSSPQAPGHFDSPPKDMAPVETLCAGAGVARTKHDKPKMTSPVRGQPREDQGNLALSPTRPGVATKAQNLSTARTALTKGFDLVVQRMLRDLEVSCSEKLLLPLSRAALMLGRTRCVSRAFSAKAPPDRFLAVAIPEEPPEEPSQNTKWCLAQNSVKSLKSFFGGNFPDVDIDGKSTSDLRTLAVEKVSTRLQQRFRWASDPPKVFVLMRCGAALTTCKNCGCLLGEKVSVIWRRTGQNKFEPAITPIERAISEDQALHFVTGAAPHHSQGKELLKAMGCFDVDTVPKHDDLVRAHPSAAHAALRALCLSGGDGVHQSNSYESHSLLAALENARKLQMGIVCRSNLSEHACRGPFVFEDSDDIDAVADKLHSSWVVVDPAGFNSKRAHPWWSRRRLEKLCLRGVTLDELLEDRTLFSEVSVTLPGSKAALRGAQLRCPDVEREHLVCWMVKVRDAFQIQQKQIISSNRNKAAWQLQLSAHFLEQFAWPPDSSSLASLTMSKSNSAASKAFLQAAALAGRGF